MSKALQSIEEYKRTVLADLLEQCTGQQQALFKRCYPHGVKDADIESAIKLCERTVQKNADTR